MTIPLLLMALLGQAAPAAPAPRAPPDPAPEKSTPAIEVSDPLLTPVPAAPQQVASWDEAIELLRQRSTDLRLALAQVEAAVGQRRVALAGLLPTVLGNISVQYNLLGPTSYNGVTSTGTGYTTTTPLGTGTLTASQTLFDLRAFQSLRAADAARHATELSLDETRRQLTRTLGQLLAREASSERLADVNRSNLRSALERLAIAERRLQLGAGTKLTRCWNKTFDDGRHVVTATGNSTQVQVTRVKLAVVVGIEIECGVFVEG